jgi:hypothetical protein
MLDEKDGYEFEKGKWNYRFHLFLGLFLGVPATLLLVCSGAILLFNLPWWGWALLLLSVALLYGVGRLGAELLARFFFD